MPMLKVFSLCPFYLRREAATLATRLESNPPESRQPIGLSDINLSLTASWKVSTISL
jgi:hypothetical protein